MRKMICLSGKAGAGKTTAANIIKAELENIGLHVNIINFGDLLKFVCEKYYGWNNVKDEDGRRLLQHVGTDIGRSIDKYYWIDFVLQWIGITELTYDVFVIGDCRFRNEIERMKRFGDMFTVRVEGPSDRTGTIQNEQERQHVSETDLDRYSFDYTLYNTETMSDLEHNIRQMLKYMGYTK